MGGANQPVKKKQLMWNGAHGSFNGDALMNDILFHFNWESMGKFKTNVFKVQEYVRGNLDKLFKSESVENQNKQ